MDFSEWPELKRSLVHSDFRIATQKQIIKDFAGHHHFFPARFAVDDYSIDQILDYVCQAVVEITQMGETRLLQLLYTIDIPEKEFLTISTDLNFVMLMAQKIVHREAYKVWLRKKFAG